jgi:hypothetical protein
LGWIGGGAAFSSDAGLLHGVFALGARVPLLDVLAVDATLALSPFRGDLDTLAGNVEVQAQQAALHLVLIPWFDRMQSVGFGLGGGALWLSETSTAVSGFEARRDDARVALLSARIGWEGHYAGWALVALLETGWALPAATVHADDLELAEVGRPWTLVVAGLGRAF